ncbi:MAG: PxKF domain-containing protein, partial [Chloroflexota bacterium]|nr:PxKF domain-containing protein [Chloroflexota bacterium]
NVTSTQVTCVAGAPVDELEQYATGSTALKNLGDGYYQITWKTVSGWAKSCRVIRVDLGEGPLPAGQRHEATFKFR